MRPIQQLLTDHIGLWTSADTVKKSGRGRASGGAGTIYGIKKLRQLILELAVCGKLVPQDPSDEPTSELLERIREEKARLVLDGIIKKDKPMALIADDEKPLALPQGWEWVRFGNIAQHHSGKTLDNGRNTGSFRNYITTSNLYWGFFELANVRQMPIRDDEREKFSARKSDLLICEGGEAGRAAVWSSDEEICFQNHIHRVRFYCDIDPYYAYRFFEKINATGEINKYRKGVGISNMSGKELASIVFPLAPIEEQHRIVAKVDELMVLCDRLEAGHTDAADAHEKIVSHLLATLTGSQDSADFSAGWQRIAAHFDMLFTTEVSIDALKQALLQLAAMGKLVPQHRDDEPASALLERLAEDAREYSINLKISPPKPEPISVDTLPGELPNGWVWARLCSLFRVITDGDHQSPPQAGEGIPFLTIGNITTGSLNFSGCRFVPKDYFDSVAKHRKPGFGDILYTVVGATYGRPVLVGTHQEFCVQRHIAILKCSEHINVRFACYLLSSPEIYEQATQCTTGTAQPTIPLRPLRNFLIRFPPIAEQHRIVAKVDELMALCDQMRERIANASALQRKLADVMVAQAVASQKKGDGDEKRIVVDAPFPEANHRNRRSMV